MSDWVERFSIEAMDAADQAEQIPVMLCVNRKGFIEFCEHYGFGPYPWQDYIIFNDVTVTVVDDGSDESIGWIVKLPFQPFDCDCDMCVSDKITVKFTNITDCPPEGFEP